MPTPARLGWTHDCYVCGGHVERHEQDSVSASKQLESEGPHEATIDDETVSLSRLRESVAVVGSLIQSLCCDSSAHAFTAILNSSFVCTHVCILDMCFEKHQKQKKITGEKNHTKHQLEQ